MDQSTPIIPDALATCMAHVSIPLSLQNRFDDDMSDNLQAYVSSSAASTLEGFRTDIVRWAAWSTMAGTDMLKPLARNVREFVREFEHGRKPSTVKRMVSNIGVLTSSTQLPLRWSSAGTSLAIRRALCVRRSSVGWPHDSASIPYAVSSRSALPLVSQ